MEPIKMIEIDPSEVIHLFDVLQKFDVVSSLELHKEGMADPFIAITSQSVKAEYVERVNDESGDAIAVHLGELELCFDIFNTSFFKHISDCQIDVCITDGKYSAFFNSGVISLEGIAEAKRYIEPNLDDLELIPTGVDAYEQELIEFIRTLEFDDLLDSREALIKSAIDAEQKAQLYIEDKNILTAKAWHDRSIKLMQLANLLADSNADYRDHIYPEVSNHE